MTPPLNQPTNAPRSISEARIPANIFRRIDDEQRATRAFYAWLELNKCRTARDAVELLESTNDNPNIRPLTEGEY